MDDLRVILEVQRHRILYDTANLFYKDNSRKEQAWSEVAAALRADAADCKARWRILRDSFVKHVKKISGPNAPPGGAQRDWKYSNSMSFLVPFIQNRAPKRRLQPSSDPECDRGGGPSSLDPSPCPGLPAAPSPASPLPLWTAPLEEERQDRPSATDSDREEMYHFALSTVPLLLRLSKRQRRRAKLEVLQTLDRLEEEEEQQAAARRYLHPPAAERPETTGIQRFPAGVQKPPAAVQKPPADARPQPSVRPDTAEVKEEPEPQPGAVCVKTEEASLLQHRQTEHRQEAQAEDLSSEPHEGHSERSSDTDNDDDWEAL